MTRPFASYDVERCRARIAARNDALHAVLTPVEASEGGARSGQLAGVPYVLKDTWDTAGIRTTGGSWRHRARVPASSAHCYRAFAEAGAVLLGKSNLCDLAFSTESDNHLRGPVRNPHDPSRTAGGSTGGGAAAVADGMAAFEWGSDFGGSIRGPAAFCGVVGLRLSTAAWPVGYHHFPRLPPFFWDMCGMGPIARDVEGAQAVVDAVRGALRRSEHPAPRVDPDRVVVWAPDRAHDDEWPSFVADVATCLHEAGVGWSLGERLPSPSRVNAVFTEYLAAHFGELVRANELPLPAALPAVFIGLFSNGRLDRRIHPNTGILLAAVTAMRAVHRDKPRAAAARAALRAACDEVWSSGALIVSPTVTMKPPRHGRAALAVRAMSFCKLGNLVDATGLAIPFGVFPGTPALPRSLQILGPPGSEDAVLALGRRLAFTRSR
ncbi:MAG: amidase [Labilithrix sp.]|nr:amidase [Labilithrix sp.]MCW5809967.1 amidase [Labilithrix sp.]